MRTICRVSISDPAAPSVTSKSHRCLLNEWTKYPVFYISEVQAEIHSRCAPEKSFIKGTFKKVGAGLGKAMTEGLRVMRKITTPNQKSMRRAGEPYERSQAIGESLQGPTHIWEVMTQWLKLLGWCPSPLHSENLLPLESLNFKF